MANSSKLKRISAKELDAVLARAQAEQWEALVLFGPNIKVSDDVGNWPDVLTTAANVFQLGEFDHRLADKLRPLNSVTSLDLSGNRIGDDDAKNIASLAKLTSLNLGWNSIGDDGAKAIATLANLESLSFGDNSIGVDGAKAIASLAKLTSLDLWYNHIGDDGAKAIATMANLKSLNLTGNNIGDDGAKAISTLANLTSLNLAGNSIGSDGAKAIATLKNLTALNLDGNAIGSDGAKAIATLTNLTNLNLEGNAITADGARAIATLANLTALNLGYNRIRVDGTRAILEAWVDGPRSDHLRTLDLRVNGDLRNLLPPEVVETTDAQAILAAYRRYRVAEAQKTLRPLGEAKLLVVGNEAVGKTSLLRYLIEGKPRDPSEKKTLGIVTHERIETRTWSPDKQSERIDISLNVWDFGGQEVMRGTHRFFLTERSLYLLVLEDRRQDDEAAAETWLKTILNRGGESPIIVVIIKSDDGKQDLRLNETGLPKTYPNIVDIVRTSCDPDDWAAASIAALRTLIATTVTDHPRLKHVSDPVPESWLRIKQAVTEMAQDRSVLSLGQFERLCEQEGEQGEAITDRAEQRALLRLLHDLGTVVAHGLERDAPAAVREITLLDPNWLTGAIYRLLNEPQVRDQDAEFERGQLALWLDPKLYPSERHEFILEMMQNPEIGLCFRLPDAPGERYLIPEALHANEPDYSNWPADSLRFRYAYDFLPPGLIPRFIVQAHRNLSEKKTRWKTGVVLSAADCQVLVHGDLSGGQIDIAVDGPHGMRRSALNIVLNDLDFVHNLNPECGPEARVPFPGRPERDVGYEYLRELEKEDGLDHLFRPEGADRRYTVSELLEGVRRDQTHTEFPRQDPDIGQPAHPTTPHVVILIHGIRTQALWQNAIRRSLEGQGLTVQPTNYGYLDLPRFLFPLSRFRKKIVDEITKQIRHTLRINKATKCSIIAHSFGTYVFTEILRRETDLDFHRIIFCGSVVRQEFRFEEYSRRFDGKLLNEVGTRDFWPVIAKAVTWGYGSAGTYGFRRPGIRDRWHNGKSHSAFLNREFCSKYWAPFLDEGQIVEDDEAPETPPWWLSVVSTLLNKYVIVAVLTYVLYVFWSDVWSVLELLLPKSA